MKQCPRSIWLGFVGKHAPESWQNKTKQTFECVACGYSMHLSEKRTGLRELALKGIQVLGSNALLLCNACLREEQNQRLKVLIKRGTERRRTPGFEREMTDLKKSIQEIIPILNGKCLQDTSLPAGKTIVKHEEPKSTASIEKLNGIRIHEVPESKEKRARECQKHDLAEFKKVLIHLELEHLFTDIVRLGQYDNK